MRPSDLCIAWIKHSEGCKLAAYWDVDGWSIGYGYHGLEITKDTVWTQDQADAHLMSKIDSTSVAVNQLVHPPVTQGQFDALCDLTYNEGAAKIAPSSLLRCLNAGDYAGARRWFYWVEPDGMQRGWIYADGDISPGLVARRKGDQVLWDGGDPFNVETAQGAAITLGEAK